MAPGKKELNKALKAAFVNTIPVLTGFSALGTAYGILMRTKGYGVLWSVLFSAVAFCGSMQFVAVTLLTVAFDPVQAFLLSVMVNARHLFYGVSVLEKYKDLGRMKAFLIYTLCDETFSIVCGVEPPDCNPEYFYFFVSALNYLYWVAGTFLGGMLGGLIAFNTEGLDFALTALFVVLLLEQLKSQENRLPALIGIASAAAGILLFGRNNPVIPAMVIILAVLIGGKKKLCP
ncbi:MAG: Inner membrane protein YgaZ [Firmicutes bacterium ADurb.Bin182]|nr:MAG: Inner membrane protein YgaZ [Firmicutes bacterium ADurb.Bin182]